MQNSLYLGCMTLLLTCVANPSFGHEFDEREITFSCDISEIGGTLTTPALKGNDKAVCVVIVGGTLSHTRDGKMIRDGAPNRDAISR